MSDEERLTLAYYVAVMLYRTPRHRRQNEARVAPVLDDVLREAHDTIERWAESRPPDDPLVRRRREELQTAATKFRAEPPKGVTDQVRSPWPSEEVFKLGVQKTWRLVVATGPEYFLTSDSPAFFFEGFGLGHPQ